MSDLPPPHDPHQPSGSGPVPPVPPGPPSSFGQPIGAPSQTPAPGWQPGGSQWTAQPAPGGGSGVKIAAIVALLAIVGLAVGAFLLLRGGDDGDSAEAPATTEAAVTPETEVPADTEAPTDSTDATDTTDTAAPQETTAPSDTAAPADTTLAPTAAPTQPPATAPATNLFVGRQAQRMIQQVKEARGADPLRILSTKIYPTYSFVQVQDPSTPANVDQYDWRDGRLADPAPVQLVGDGDLEANLYSDTEVAWDAIPGLIESAPATTQIDDGVVTHVIVERNLPFTDQVVIRVYVDGSRKDAFVQADAQGNVIQVMG